MSENNSNDLQNQFDSLLSKYMTLKKQVFEQVLRDATNRDKYYKYFGKSVFWDGAYWYINNLGVAHKYPQGGDAWRIKSKSCPQSLSGSVDISGFKKGPDMIASQACGVAGNNIMNERTGEFAWVDMEGYKHIYDQSAYNNRPVVCQKKPIIVSSVEYNAIPEGPPMTKDDYCLSANIDKDDYKTLQDLNSQIISISQRLLAENAKLQADDETQQRELENQRAMLAKQLASLEREKTQLRDELDELNTTSQESSDASRQDAMYNANTLVYGLSGLLLGYMALRLI